MYFFAHHHLSKMSLLQEVIQPEPGILIIYFCETHHISKISLLKYFLLLIKELCLCRILFSSSHQTSKSSFKKWVLCTVRVSCPHHILFKTTLYYLKAIIRIRYYISSTGIVSSSSFVLSLITSLNHQ